MIYLQVRINVDDVYGGSVFYEVEDGDYADFPEFSVPDAPGYEVEECSFEDWSEMRGEPYWMEYRAYPSFGSAFNVLVGDGGIDGYDDPRAEYIFGDAVEEWEPAS